MYKSYKINLNFFFMCQGSSNFVTWNRELALTKPSTNHSHTVKQLKVLITLNISKYFYALIVYNPYF